MVRANRWESLRTAVAALCVCSCDPAPDGDPPSAAVPQNGAAPDAAVIEAPPPASEPPPRGFAVVRGGAAVFSKPDASASIGTLPKREPTPPKDPALVPPPASGTVVAVVGAQGDFIAVESLVDPKQHCAHGRGAHGLGAWADLRVGLFVRKSDLVQVTTRQVEHAFADGTRVVVSPGAAVGDTVTGAGERIVDGGGIGLELPLPADAIGTYYEPTPRAPQTAPAERVGATALAYGRGRPLGPAESLDRDRDGVFAYERKATDDSRVLVRVGSRCAEVWALTDASAVASAGMHAVGLYAMRGSASESHFAELMAVGDGPSSEIRAGAALSWPDGRVAGLAERAVTTSQTPRKDGTRSCVVVPFAIDASTGPELCVAASDLTTTHPAAEIGSLFALGGEPEDIPEGWGGLIGAESEGAVGLGSTGTSGTSGALPSSKTASKVKPGSAKVHGSLDKDIIRRVIRASVSKVRHCYEKELAFDATLAGKLTVSFVIGPDGKVTSASVKDSTLANAKVETCVVKAIERLAFPEPVGGGVVAVSYPFVFTSE